MDHYNLTYNVYLLLCVYIKVIVNQSISSDFIELLKTWSNELITVYTIFFFLINAVKK